MAIDEVHYFSVNSWPICFQRSILSKQHKFALKCLWGGGERNSIHHRVLDKYFYTMLRVHTGELGEDRSACSRLIVFYFNS